ncbi:hypothetical protein [Embleya sp. NBC_00896]|uniref:hypothetical protein n=1 Tax=Embleya sp. NBC_00896 TaxID=2975961 RepID=UPI00386BE44B|nr:hypothetical protein OG928_31875 [Embleya sp. NBC_00896]
MAITPGSDVWYISYGSNMNQERFRYYIEGGTPPGSTKLHQGSIDQTPIRESRPVIMPGGIFFGDHKSLNWNAAVSFYDPNLPGEMPAVAHRVTQKQFSDLTLQEMDRVPEREPDLDMGRLLRDGHLKVADGWYGEVRVVGHIDGIPAVTFTGPSDASSVRGRPPGLAYLKMLATGLQNNFAWSPERAARYLANRPGAKGTWKARPLAKMLRANAGGAGNPKNHKSHRNHKASGYDTRPRSRHTRVESGASTRATPEAAPGLAALRRGMGPVSRRPAQTRVTPSAGKARVSRGIPPHTRIPARASGTRQGVSAERERGL